MRLTALVLFLSYAAIAAGKESETRIANRGELARAGEFPFQVSIRAAGQHFCGGSLISKSHVLTAAHCVQPGVDQRYFPGPVTVEVGAIQLGQGKVHKVKRISYLRGFQMMSMQFLPNDISIIHLSEPVETSDKVAIINLPAAGTSLPEGSTVIASGFGVDDARFGQISQVLKKMDAQVVSHGRCQQYHRQQIHIGKMCAAKGPGYGTCKGDSGGPLVDATKKTIIGIVSGGDGECKAGTPDVYTEVSRFMTYINEELNLKPGTRTQNPAIDFDQQSGVPSPTLPPNLPTLPPQSPGIWPWPCMPVPQNPQQRPWGHWGLQSQQYPPMQWQRVDFWHAQQTLPPCPPLYPQKPLDPSKPTPQQPLIPEKPKPQNPWNPQQPLPQKPWNPQQPFTQQPWNPQQPFTQQPWNPLQPFPQKPWNPQQPFPQKPWDPQQPFPQYPWPPQQPTTKKPENQWNPQQPQHPLYPQNPQNPLQPQDPLDPSNPNLEESIAV